MTGDYLRRTVLSSKVAWTFNAWGDNPAALDDKEVIVFDHPDPDEDKAIKLEIEGNVPNLASLPDDDTSVSSSESDNASMTYYDLDDLVDDVIDYASELKNHSELVRLIQTMTEVDTAIKGLRVYSCEREPPTSPLCSQSPHVRRANLIVLESHLQRSHQPKLLHPSHRLCQMSW